MVGSAPFHVYSDISVDFNKETKLDMTTLTTRVNNVFIADQD